MKKILKIFAIVIAALILLTFAALKFAPGFAKDYVVAHSEELIGRKMTIESINFNPFTFVVDIDSFTVMEPDGISPFVAFEEFRVNVDPLKMLSKTAAVSEIYMKGLYVHVTQNGDQFNFSDILEFLDKKQKTLDENRVAEDGKQTTAVQGDTTSTDSASVVNAAEIAEGLPVSISVENIRFENGNIIYEDQKVGSKIQLQDFNIGIPAVYLSNKQTDVGLSLKFAEGGDLSINVEANAATNDFKVNLGLENFALACGKPYMRDFINFKDFNGNLTTHIQVEGNLNDVLASNVKGTVALDRIKLTETSGQSLGVTHVGVGIARANLKENNFHIDSVIVDGAFAHLDMDKNGKTNIDALLKSNPPVADTSATNGSTTASPAATDSVFVTTTDSTATTANEKTTNEKSAQKLKAKIDQLIVRNTTASVNDQTITKPFHYTVSAISVNGTNINFDNPCAISISAAFPEGGKLNVKYQGVLSDLSSMNAYIGIKNLALKHFSPYSLHYTGYPISAGTMAFASENQISNYNLESKNTIDIYNIDVGDKDPSIDPEFTVPMKVGLYILKDKDDKIQFDVPVKGNMKDPEFSVLKIIWKTVMNLIIKVAISPFKIVENVAATGANVVGLDLGNKDEVRVNALSATFTSEQYAKAIRMTEMLKKDPKLTLTFTQFYNPKKMAAEYKTHKLKTEYYKQSQGKTTLNELDEIAIGEIKDGDEGYKAYAEANAASINESQLKKELAELATQRNQDLIKVLLQQSGVTQKNVKIVTAPASALLSYRGKAAYKVTIDIQ